MPWRPPRPTPPSLGDLAALFVGVGAGDGAFDAMGHVVLEAFLLDAAEAIQQLGLLIVDHSGLRGPAAEDATW